MVTHDGTGVAVPEPGTAVTVDALTADGETHGFTMEVTSDGKVSYDLAEASADTSTVGADVPHSLAHPVTTPQGLSQESDSTDADASDSEAEGVEVADVDAQSSPGACSDGAYNTADRKEYGTYNRYIGDGGMPGGLSRTDAKWAFDDAINNITDSHNNCGMGDSVGAETNLLPETSYQADIKQQLPVHRPGRVEHLGRGRSQGQPRRRGLLMDLAGARRQERLPRGDVRFNTRDHEFTNKPTSRCSNKYDIRSVGTHEAAHVFGLGHVGSGHENLTMYTDSFTCTTKARTLGKGDVLALRSIYRGGRL
ncbi:hypothetical protein GCM10010103_57120 [Streptomyces paradoxus]|uniref:Peptidase M10 metallopeptidase domain-containing protein n=1 Tax=Streptomyces paradoxus TaxID=66375 RepID=A0A7W9TFG4_9ACTN|nr:matrixin family metalloprotease [Streptomyces paradoxus]MBB6079286.1 hypothetical protein [Streptomyces paradoxus]